LFTGYIDTFLSAFHDPLPINEFWNLFIVNLFWSLIFIFISFHIFKTKDILN